MTVSRRWPVMGAMFAFVAALPLVAQESGAPKGSDTKPARKTYDPVRRVPNYFNQVGLTAEQRESIYKVRGKYVERIDALQKQIDELEGQMMTECEAVLTDSQKKLLEQHRAARKEQRAAKAAGKSDKNDAPADKTEKKGTTP